MVAIKATASVIRTPSVCSVRFESCLSLSLNRNTNPLNRLTKMASKSSRMMTFVKINNRSAGPESL